MIFSSFPPGGSQPQTRPMPWEHDFLPLADAQLGPMMKSRSTQGDSGCILLSVPPSFPFCTAPTLACTIAAPAPPKNTSVVSFLHTSGRHGCRCVLSGRPLLRHVREKPNQPSIGSLSMYTHTRFTSTYRPRAQPGHGHATHARNHEHVSTKNFRHTRQIL